MPVTAFSDEWLAHSLEGLLTAELLEQLRGKADAGRTLWEMVVAEKIATDAQIIDKLSHRFRLKVADASQIDPTIREGVPEQLARRYRVLPLRLTDSYLELATANPFDPDAEKALAFATAREIRLLLLPPSKISEKLDEMYKPNKAIDKLLEGMGDAEVLTTLPDVLPEELNVSEADASQKPVVRLVDMIISEGILSRASDIHVEPEEGGVAVRYRIDGVLRQVMKIPRQAGLPLISRINIVTVEDPVEYRMQGIVQVQVQEKAGLTFAAALRSILRQDPNVVLVGEIRDKETAQIAVQASLTGHLVLSTLHTNDAANAVTRLVDIGVESYKIAASLRGVVAQRLMRKLCPTCKEVWMEAPPERLRRWIPKGTPLYRAAGCPDCAMTGYRGRFSILEILTMTPELERLIAAGEPADRIAEAAQRGGMKSLWDSGLAHVARGESTLDELTRVVDIPAEAEAPRSTGAPNTVGVPLEPAAPVSTIFDLLEESAPPARRSGAHGQPASKVLLVDDEDSLRKVMRDLLERDGYVVTEASDGVQALDQVDRVGPDIIVLDLNLPGVDGYGVLSHR